MSLWKKRALIGVGTLSAVVLGSLGCYFLGLGAGIATLWGVLCGSIGGAWMASVDIEDELDRIEARMKRHVVKEQG